MLGRDWEEKQPACVEHSPPLSRAEFQEISIGKALPSFLELRSSTLALFLAFVLRLWLQLDRVILVWKQDAWFILVTLRVTAEVLGSLCYIIISPPCFHFYSNNAVLYLGIALLSISDFEH